MASAYIIAVITKCIYGIVLVSISSIHFCWRKSIISLYLFIFCISIRSRYVTNDELLTDERWNFCMEIYWHPKVFFVTYGRMPNLGFIKLFFITREIWSIFDIFLTRHDGKFWFKWFFRGLNFLEILLIYY